MSELLPTGTVTLLLAIELAAARIRALSLRQIVDSLHDRFRLLTGGARTAVRRQQTLRASVDWSHALLTESVREALGDSDFDIAWAEGAALSTDEAIAYAQRGRGERTRRAGQ